MLFNNWNISGCVKFRMLDNKTSSFDVSGDIPEGWSWQLLYSCNGNLNIVEMYHEENILSVIFTKEMLPTDGTYLFQLKATKDELVKHTNIVKSYVNKSLSGDIKWPVIPTEFTQIEQVVKGYAESAKKSSIKAENAAVHSPIVGENGNWFIWDFEKSEYVDSGKPASTPPITHETAGKYLTNDGSKAEWGVMPGGADLSLGLTAATIGQTVKVKAIDTDGKPTAWEAVDFPSGEVKEWEEFMHITVDNNETTVFDFSSNGAEKLENKKAKEVYIYSPNCSSLLSGTPDAMGAVTVNGRVYASGLYNFARENLGSLKLWLCAKVDSLDLRYFGRDTDEDLGEVNVICSDVKESNGLLSATVNAKKAYRRINTYKNGIPMPSGPVDYIKTVTVSLSAPSAAGVEFIVYVR